MQITCWHKPGQEELKTGNWVWALRSDPGSQQQMDLLAPQYRPALTQVRSPTEGSRTMGQPDVTSMLTCSLGQKPKAATSVVFKVFPDFFFFFFNTKYTSKSDFSFFPKSACRVGFSNCITVVHLVPAFTASRQDSHVWMKGRQHDSTIIK